MDFVYFNKVTYNIKNDQHSSKYLLASLLFFFFFLFLDLIF
jgi:hypothetical protein